MSGTRKTAKNKGESKQLKDGMRKLMVEIYNGAVDESFANLADEIIKNMDSAKMNKEEINHFAELNKVVLMKANTNTRPKEIKNVRRLERDIARKNAAVILQDVEKLLKNESILNDVDKLNNNSDDLKARMDALLLIMKEARMKSDEIQKFKEKFDGLIVKATLPSLPKTESELKNFNSELDRVFGDTDAGKRNAIIYLNLLKLKLKDTLTLTEDEINKMQKWEALLKNAGHYVIIKRMSDQIKNNPDMKLDNDILNALLDQRVSSVLMNVSNESFSPAVVEMKKYIDTQARETEKFITAIDKHREDDSLSDKQREKLDEYIKPYKEMQRVLTDLSNGNNFVADLGDAVESITASSGKSDASNVGHAPTNLANFNKLMMDLVDSNPQWAVEYFSDRQLVENDGKPLVISSADKISANYVYDDTASCFQQITRLGMLLDDVRNFYPCPALEDVHRNLVKVTTDINVRKSTFENAGNPDLKKLLADLKTQLNALKENMKDDGILDGSPKGKMILRADRYLAAIDRNLDSSDPELIKAKLKEIAEVMVILHAIKSTSRSPFTTSRSQYEKQVRQMDSLIMHSDFTSEKTHPNKDGYKRAYSSIQKDLIAEKNNKQHEKSKEMEPQNDRQASYTKLSG